MISGIGYLATFGIAIYLISFVLKKEKQPGGLAKFLSTNKASVAIKISAFASFIQVFSLTSSDPSATEGLGYLTTFLLYVIVSTAEAFFGIIAISVLQSLSIKDIKYTLEVTKRIPKKDASGNPILDADGNPQHDEKKHKVTKYSLKAMSKSFKISIFYFMSLSATYTMLLLRLSNINLEVAQLNSDLYWSVLLKVDSLPFAESLPINFEDNIDILLTGSDLASCILILLSQFFVAAAAIMSDVKDEDPKKEESPN